MNAFVLPLCKRLLVDEFVEGAFALVEYVTVQIHETLVSRWKNSMKTGTGHVIRSIRTWCYITLLYFEQTLNTWAIKPLRNNAGHVYQQRVSQHYPRDYWRGEKPKYPKGKDCKPVSKLSARRFNQKTIQVLSRKIVQPLLFETPLFPNRSSVRQQMLPSFYTEYLVVNAPVSFETMRFVKERIWRIVTVGQVQAKYCYSYLQ